jgi:hypothetical protein
MAVILYGVPGTLITYYWCRPCYISIGADPEEFNLTKDDLSGADINKLPLTHPEL